MSASAEQAEVVGDAGLTLVMMPFLGGSWQEWQEVHALLSPEFRCLGLDLPGFGEAVNEPGYTVAEMVAYVARQVSRIGRFVLVGHSMAGKVSMVLAAQAARGELAQLHGLAGLVLVASSPPAPEPMPEVRRARMIAQLGTRGPEFRTHAEEFIQANLDGILPPEIFERAVDDVLRMNCDAWTAWLESGSKEDWTERVGVLKLPALVVAGGADKDLGEDAQRKLVLPHFEVAKLAVVGGAAHLVPMERPQGLATLIAEFVRTLDSGAKLGEYMEFVRSSRVSEATRAVLLKRLQRAEGGTVFSSREMDPLRAVAACVIPQGDDRIDLAARLDAQLGEAKGKGWRYDELPEGLTAYRAALAAIEAYAQKKHGEPFDALLVDDQRAVIGLVAKGALAGSGEAASLMESVPSLTAAQMQRWFEDCRGDLTGIYMAHPRTLARIGYSGIGDGADSTALTGFVQLGLGKVAAWEPPAEKVG